MVLIGLLWAASPTEDAENDTWTFVKDAKNDYVARANPLESIFRVNTVVDGKRTQLQVAETTYPGAWYLLRVTMKGDQIVCYKDGVKSLDVHNATFPGRGKIGHWSKSDAQTVFDALKLQGL
jgi:hypothetical protein